MNQLELIVCDLETTGFQPDQNKIIEIAMARIVDGEIVDSFTSLVNPQCSIPLKIKRLTGIDNQLVASSPSWQQIMGDIKKFVTPVPLVGHSIEFDRAFLEANLGRLPFTTNLDTLELARVIVPDAPGHSLAALARYLGLKSRELHRAMDDVLTTTDLYLTLAKKLELLSMEVLLQLLPLLRQGQSTWIQVIETLTKDKIANFSRAKITGRVPIKEPLPTTKPLLKQPQDLKHEANLTIENLLGPESPLAELLPNYELRREQINMASAVDETLAEGKVLLVEAGTGTGKSLAYMVPALLWSLHRDQRAVIATNTINLQEQLWHKDIPMLKKLINTPFQTALLKGRANYLCLRRFFHLAGSVSSLTPDEAKLTARILVWLQHTDSGDRAELNLFGPDNETWLQLCSESESCLGNSCRWYNRYCFVTRARRNAENAQLLIINHALLFTDMIAEMKILPPHDTLIIDEAHHIDDTATMHLGKKVSRSGIGQWLSLVGRTFKKFKGTVPPRDNKQWFGALSEAEQERYELKESADTFFNCLASGCAEHTTQGFNTNRFRLHREPHLLALVDAEWQNFLYCLRSFLTGGLKTVRNLLEDWTASGEPWEDKLQDVMFVSGLGTGHLADLLFIMGEPADNYVYWLDVYRHPYQQGYVNCTLHATPVDISKMLYEQLFSTSRSIVLTSATMTVNGSFEHFMSRCGLDLLPAERVHTRVMNSPFDYEHQCLLYVADHIPLPAEVSVEDYLNALVDTIYHLVLDTGGRTLVLFTAHKLLRDVYHRIKPRLEDSGICLLGHNLDGGRGRLVDAFIKDGRSVLFGSSSFWEGVDIPGEALVSVIIVKLPFAPPYDPIQEARQELIIARGHNAFYGLSLPQAVIRFKQGFGRLIRSNRDRGTVVVLDRRIIEKRYGRVFFNSLPVETHLRGELAAFRKILADWIR